MKKTSWIKKTALGFTCLRLYILNIYTLALIVFQLTEINLKHDHELKLKKNKNRFRKTHLYLNKYLSKYLSKYLKNLNSAFQIPKATLKY